MNNKRQDSWEDDSVWGLLDSVEAPKAGPTFVQDVMRKVRQGEGEPARPWWKSLFAPVPLTAGALAAAAAIALVVSLPRNADTPALTGGGTGAEPALGIEEAVDQQLLIAAAEDPSLFSDEEVLAMLY